MGEGEEVRDGVRVRDDGSQAGERVLVTPEIFRKTWKLQFQYAHRLRLKRVLVGQVLLIVVVLSYILFFRQIPDQYFIFATGLLALVGLREGIRGGSYAWDRLHHFGWIKENIEEESEKVVHFGLTTDGFNLSYEDFDIHYRWAAFASYFDAEGLLWLLDEKGEMVWVACNAEIPQQWEGFKKGILENVPLGDADQMKP